MASPFAENRQDVLVAAINARSFGTLITAHDGDIQLSHAPFLCQVQDGAITLIGHLARNNPQLAHLRGHASALVSFLIDDAYISPGWYPTKHETGRAVPTWNYMSVAARGGVELVEDKDALLALVDDLTARHEEGRPKPWTTGEAPLDYIEGLLKGIVGLKISVQALSGIWKMSQNKNAADRHGVAEGLRAEGKAQFAGHITEI